MHFYSRPGSMYPYDHNNWSVFVDFLPGLWDARETADKGWRGCASI